MLQLAILYFFKVVTKNNNVSFHLRLGFAFCTWALTKVIRILLSHYCRCWLLKYYSEQTRRANEHRKSIDHLGKVFFILSAKQSLRGNTHNTTAIRYLNYLNNWDKKRSLHNSKDLTSIYVINTFNVYECAVKYWLHL